MRSRCIDERHRHRGRRATPRAEPAVLGRRRQRTQHRSRPRRCASSCPSSATRPIACDVTEDKKHIDLSSEPLILVCAAGLAGSNVDDVAKEVAIYRAHQRRAAGDRQRRRGPDVLRTRLEVIVVPSVDPALAFVLSTVAGHLFGYEAALAIDAQARPLREARAAIESAAAGPPDALLERLAPPLEGPAQRFVDGLRAGQFDGTMEASTATRIASLLRYAGGGLPLDSYEVEHGNLGTPSTVVHDLTAALTKGIDELTRPVDAIKHQAKTVTVGISRSDETLLARPAGREVLAAGARARRPQLPGAAHARRPRPRGRGGHRLHPLPGRRRRRRRCRDDPRRRPGRRRRGARVAHRPGPAPAGHEAPRREPARGDGGARPSRRPDPGHRPRGEGTTRRSALDPAARPLRRHARARRRCAASSRPTRAATAP